MRWVLWFALAACAFAIAAVLFPRSPGSPVSPASSPMHDVAAGRPGLSGRARVIDGDSVIVGGTHVRLHGLDAPEGEQTCLADGQRWPCGRLATRALAALIDGRVLTCRELDRDRGRTYAVCRRDDALDINASLVAEGWAVAYRRYSEEYVEDESEAKAARRGVWRGEFVMPWDWRQGKRLQTATESLAATPATERQSPRCNIKGNISYNSGARIYHMPGDQDYAGTRISVERGERWFCSEREAQAAGWRRAGR